MAKLDTTRTGIVFIEDFDVGVAVSIGGQLVQVTSQGRVTEKYAISVAGVTGPDEYQGLIPIVFDAPDDAYQKEYLPQIHMVQSGINPAPQRWQSGGHEYRVAAPQAKIVKGWTGEMGPTMVETKGFAAPYDITYDLHIRATRRRQASRILRRVGKVLSMYGVVTVIDSEGFPRTYDAFQESINDLSDVVDTQEREVGWTISTRVEGELDFNDPYITKTAYKFRLTAGIGSEES